MFHVLLLTAVQQALETVAQKLDVDGGDNSDTENDIIDNYKLRDCEELQMIVHPVVDFDTLGVTGIEDISLEDFPTSESTRLMTCDKQQVLGKCGEQSLDMA